MRRPARLALAAGAAALLSVVSLLGGLAWALRGGPTGDARPPSEVEPSREPRPGTAAVGLRIRPLRVMHFETVGKEAEPRGRIGEQSFATRHGDAVTLAVELSAEGYFYLIGFNFDGRDQLLWPVDDKGEPSDCISPPKRARLRYPVGEYRLYLDDKTRSGLQAYAMVASSRRLPPYAEWRRGRAGVSWQALPPGKAVWEADAKGTYEVVPGLGADRGTIREAPGVPPLSGLCRGLLGGGVEVVEAIAFPVLPKEGK